MIYLDYPLSIWHEGELLSLVGYDDDEGDIFLVTDECGERKVVEMTALQAILAYSKDEGERARWEMQKMWHETHKGGVQ